MAIRREPAGPIRPTAVGANAFAPGKPRESAVELPAPSASQSKAPGVLTTWRLVLRWRATV